MILLLYNSIKKMPKYSKKIPENFFWFFQSIQVNTLSKGMMDEFVPLFDRLQNDDKVKGIVVISAKPGSFIAGADIK